MNTGVMSPQFTWHGATVSVQTVVDPKSDTVAVQAQSSHFANGTLAIFSDYPYASDANKFDAPFVGAWNATSNHTMNL